MFELFLPDGQTLSGMSRLEKTSFQFREKGCCYSVGDANTWMDRVPTLLKSCLRLVFRLPVGLHSDDLGSEETLRVLVVRGGRFRINDVTTGARRTILTK